MWNSRLGWSMCAVALSGCAFEVGAPTEAENVAQLSEGLVKNALSRPQEAMVLKLVDDTCGDTWCEGDHNFSFDRLQCRDGCGARPGSCKLTFRLFSHDTDVDTGPTYLRSCKTSGFTGLDSLAVTTGSYQSLAPAYYEALTECIAKVESELPSAHRHSR